MIEQAYLFTFLSALLPHFIGYILCFTILKGKADKFYDGFGSLGFIFQLVYLYVHKILYNQPILPIQILVTLFVLIWELRMGGFLVYRMSIIGKDSRFDLIKNDKKELLLAFFVHYLWNIITLMPTTILFFQKQIPEEQVLGYVAIGSGCFLYLLGLIIEGVADIQKLNFKLDKNNQGKFINTGLWSYSRHPNYLGEFMVWIGIFVICAVSYDRYWKLAAVLSPIYMIFQICCLSGINILEESADKKWGHMTEYQEYKNKSGVLFFNFKAMFAKN